MQIYRNKWKYVVEDDKMLSRPISTIDKPNWSLIQLIHYYRAFIEE